MVDMASWERGEYCKAGSLGRRRSSQQEYLFGEGFRDGVIRQQRGRVFCRWSGGRLPLSDKLDNGACSFSRVLVVS